MSYDIEYCRKYEPIFGSWYTKRKLGEGNFGAVFEIEREDFGTKYHSALKVVSIPKNRSELESILNDTLDETATERYLEQVVERIIKEFELMAKLKGNTNVVSYEDHQVIRHADDAGWDILIRMELLTPLLSYFKEREITRADIVRVGIDICRALELCEKHNIVHRDIKPENIFVSESGDFKLGDFGIAKQVEESQSEQTKIGTPSYMAPEVVKGHKYDSSVDMYSLGVVLYRFLNHNRTPFMPPFPNEISYGDKDRAFGERVNSGKPFPMPTNVGSRELAKIIIKACSYNPADRYSSPAQMRKALENVLAKEKKEVLSVPIITGGTRSDVPPAPLPADEPTVLIESQNRYEVGGNETVVFDNVTDDIVALKRIGNEPLDIVITTSDGRTTEYTDWTEKTLYLSAGDKVQITNTNNSNVVFSGHFGSTSTPIVPAGTNSSKDGKSKLVPVLVCIIAALIILLAAMFILPGKNSENGGGQLGEESDSIKQEPSDELQEVFVEVPDDEISADEIVELEGIAGLPENIELKVNETYKLVPKPVPDEAVLDDTKYSSSDESAVTVSDDGTITAVSESKAVITVKCAGVSKKVNVAVTVDNDGLVSQIEAAIAKAADEIASVKNNNDKNLSSLSGRIASVDAVIADLQGRDFASESDEALEEYSNLLTEKILSETEALLREVESLETVKKCSYCGSTKHTIHPKCAYCGSYDHTEHPKCSYCGSYDHTEHPKCSYCGSYDHTTHPKCNICGSMEHAVHPAISADL